MTRPASTTSTARIRYGHRVVRADWSSADAQWNVEAQRTDTGEIVQLSCTFLFSCTGYYRYDQGHVPAFSGQADFAGPVVHPQHWPADLDYTGKRVVVVGSGATAVTLVPAMAGACRARHDGAALAQLRAVPTVAGRRRRRPAPDTAAEHGPFRHPV